MKYPDPARCRFPGPVGLEPPTCHCGRPLARVNLTFTAPDGRVLVDPYWRHVPARNPRKPGDNVEPAAKEQRSWVGYVGAFRVEAGISGGFSTEAPRYPTLSEATSPSRPQERTSHAADITPGLGTSPHSGRPHAGAGGRLPVYASLDELRAAGFGAVA